MRGGVLRGFALDPGHADGEGVEEAPLQVRRRGAQLRGVNRSERPYPGKAVIDDPVPAPAQPAPRPGHIADDAAHHRVERPHSTHGILTSNEVHASKTEPMRMAA